jgi:electron transfer flavoprotein beta subunit
MKRILVLIKQVPTTESVCLNEETGTMIRTGHDTAVNPLDLHAIEEAVRIKDASSEAAKITVLSMGPPQAKTAIRDALSMGCDEGILLSGREFAGSDTWATAYTLACGIRRLGTFDLIMCGERATDGETGQVGPMVAAMLGLPLLTYVSCLLWDSSGFEAQRAIEGGKEIVRCPSPAVVCVLREMNDPRLPALSGKVRAEACEVSTWDGHAIDADGAVLGLMGSPTRVVSVLYPSFQRSTALLDSANEGIEAVVDRLEAFMKIGASQPKDGS